MFLGTHDCGSSNINRAAIDPVHSCLAMANTPSHTRRRSQNVMCKDTSPRVFRYVNSYLIRRQTLSSVCFTTGQYYSTVKHENNVQFELRSKLGSRTRFLMMLGQIQVNRLPRMCAESAPKGGSFDSIHCGAHHDVYHLLNSGKGVFESVYVGPLLLLGPDLLSFFQRQQSDFPYRSSFLANL